MNCKLHFKVLLTGIGLLFSQYVFSQTIGYIQQDIVKTPGITTDAQINGLPAGKVETTRQYFDGLGRLIQTVNVQASANLNNDIIQISAYNSLGQQPINYLPYADNNPSSTIGSYRSTAVTDQSNYYNTNSTSSNQNKVANDSNPWSQQVFENSPLQRVLQSGMTGNGFQPGQHYKSMSYRSNTSGDNVIKWGFDGSYQNSYAANTLFVTDGKDEDGQETQLFKDTNGHLVLKRQVSSNGNLDTYYIYNAAGFISFVVPPKAVVLLNPVYDLNQPAVNALIFRYAYDNMGRPTQRKIPGAAAIYIVYDPFNRPVLIQDGNLRNNSQWNYIKYDAKGRAIAQGIYSDAVHIDLASMQSYVSSLPYTNRFENRSGTAPYYTNNAFPTVNNDGSALGSLAYSYYDDYDLNQDGTDDYSYTATGLLNEATATALTRGLPTMIRKRTVGQGLNNIWLLNVMFYDKNNHLIQTRSNNQLNYAAEVLTDTKTTALDFTGMPVTAKVVKVTGIGAANTTAIQTSFAYDNNRRLLSIDQQYNSAPALRVADYQYNELGQLVKKGFQLLNSGAIPSNVTLDATNSLSSGGQLAVLASGSITLKSGFLAAAGSTFSAKIITNYLQAIDYRYNIRGQLLSINNSKLADDNGTTNNDSNDLFGMQLLYDQTDGNIGNTAHYNGRLSAVSWMSKDGNGTNSYERSYKYNYDTFNRYTGAAYAERATASTTAFNSNVGGFDEGNIVYDENGNIKTLNRNASTPGTNSVTQIDNLTYNYNSNNPNQLLNVSDGTDANHTAAGFRNYTGSAANYVYDNNSGNLTTDPYKGLNISYNQLNRTDKITVTTSPNRYIYYTYDATGVLIRKQQYDNSSTPQTTTDYIDGAVYINGILSYAAMPEGRLLNINGTLKPEYSITDQQGNTRISFQDNGNGVAVVKQENSYYGFGLVMPNSPVPLPGTPNKQLYNGGSEWQNDYGNLPDYYQTYYRNYDPALGRWISLDPKAESAESMSGYQYAGNNPIMMNDPMGDIFSTWQEVSATIDNLNNSGFGGNATGPGADEYTRYTSSQDEFYSGAAQIDMNGWWGASRETAANYQKAAYNFNNLIGNGKNVDSDKNPFLLSGVTVVYGNQQSYLNADAEIQRQINATFKGGNGANQGGGSESVFVGGALLTSGWTIDGADPEPFSKVGGAIVMTGVSAYVLYQNRTYLTNSAVSLYNKMTTEIDRIAQKATGPQGFTYALVATSSGSYPNVRGGTTFLNIGDVWKFGQTTSGSRYSDNYLNGAGLRKVDLFPGNQMEIKIQEKIMIYGYFMENGTLPPGNSIFR